MALFDLEVENARLIAKNRGFPPEAFIFAHKGADVKILDRSSALKYNVIVTVNGVRKRYIGGHGKDWLTPFERDLCDGWIRGHN